MKPRIRFNYKGYAVAIIIDADFWMMGSTVVLNQIESWVKSHNIATHSIERGFSI